MIVSVHLGYVLGHLPFERRFRAARRLGFSAVEFPFPYDVPAVEYARLLRDNGLVQVSIGAPTANYRVGEPGYAVNADLADAFDASISQAIAYATQIGCPLIHVFAGALRAGAEVRTGWQTFAKNLAAADDRAAASGIGLVIEPINSLDFPGYFIDRPTRAMAAIEATGRTGIKIILDLYHSHMMGEDPIAFLRDHHDAIAHVQLADYPGRHEPGTGKLDFNAVFSALDAVKFQGSIGLEYIPTRPIRKGMPFRSELGLA
jgi:hydroxypyruvate isomerase